MTNLLPRTEIANLLATDEAFRMAVINRSVDDMQLVLRAHGYDTSIANTIIWFGEQELIQPGFNA